MPPALLLRAFAIVVLICTGCAPANPSVDVTQTSDAPDAAALEDIAASDITGDTPADALDDMHGSDTFNVDAGADAGLADATDILGMLSGSCGTLHAMLHSPAPSLVNNVLVFDARDMYARALLSSDGQRLFDTANAGGSSGESEVMSFEVLRYCENAVLVKTETEILYAPPDDSGANSITDILVGIGGERVGVSVTRAYRPRPMVLTDTAVRDLLITKLRGVNRSSMRVLPVDRWVKQILHVFAADMDGAMAVARMWPTIDEPTRADTIVLVTLTQGGGFIYCNPDPPLGMECPPLSD